MSRPGGQIIEGWGVERFSVITAITVFTALAIVIFRLPINSYCTSLYTCFLSFISTISCLLFTSFFLLNSHLSVQHTEHVLHMPSLFIYFVWQTHFHRFIHPSIHLSVCPYIRPSNPLSCSHSVHLISPLHPLSRLHLFCLSSVCFLLQLLPPELIYLFPIPSLLISPLLVSIICFLFCTILHLLRTIFICPSLFVYCFFFMPSHSHFSFLHPPYQFFLCPSPSSLSSAPVLILSAHTPFASARFNLLSNICYKLPCP